MNEQNVKPASHTLDLLKHLTQASVLTPGVRKQNQYPY